MPDPYRTTTCPACDHDAPSPLACLHCRGACCEACALAGVCATCVERALEVAERVAGARRAGPPPDGPAPTAPRYGVAIALGSMLGSVAAWLVSLTVQGAALRDLGAAVATRASVDRLVATADPRVTSWHARCTRCRP